MTTPPAPDPYGVLGVGKDATATDIKTAYRKLVLKCHPDKIKDEAKRVEGQDVFQRVQQAYELLSDEAKRAKHDQKAQLAEARKAADKTASPSARPSSPYFKTTAFEYRGGKFYEEKTFVRPGDDEDIRFTEMPPRASARKYETYERKPSSKDDEKKKKSNRASDSKYESVRASKEKRSSRSDRAKHRDKERRREQSDKQSRTTTAYVVSEGESEPEPQPRGPSKSPKPRTYEKSESQREPKSKWDSHKYVYVEDNAFEYIQRSKASVTPEPERRGPAASYSSPPPQPYYQTVESIPGDTARRSSARVVRPVRADSDRKEPVEVVEGPLRGRAESRKPTSPPTVQSIRRAPRGSKEIPTLRRGETAPAATATLSASTTRRAEPVSSRPTKARERYDSGYSSPGTPDRHGSPPKSSKYTIVDEDDEYSRGPRTVLVDSYKRHQSVSPRRMTPIAVRQGSRPPPQSRAREPPLSRTESARVIPPTRPSHPPLRHTTNLFGEVDTDDTNQRFTSEQIRFSPKIRQEDIRFSHNKTYRPGVVRKESYAY